MHTIFINTKQREKEGAYLFAFDCVPHSFWPVTKNATIQWIERVLTAL